MTTSEKWSVKCIKILSVLDDFVSKILIFKIPNFTPKNVGFRFWPLLHVGLNAVWNFVAPSVQSFWFRPSLATRASRWHRLASRTSSPSLAGRLSRENTADIRSAPASPLTQTPNPYPACPWSVRQK